MTVNIIEPTKYQMIRSRLKEYGLNPIDWRLRPSPSSTNRFLFLSKHDPEFVLEGEILRGSEPLRLASLRLLQI